MTEPFSQADTEALPATCATCVSAAPLEPMLTTQEVVNFLGVPVDTLYAWRSVGDGPIGHKLGKHLRFYREDLLAFVASKKVV